MADNTDHVATERQSKHRRHGRVFASDRCRAASRDIGKPMCNRGEKPLPHLADTQTRPPRKTHDVTLWCRSSWIDRWRQRGLQCRHPVPHANGFLLLPLLCNTGSKSTRAFPLLHRRKSLEIVLRRTSGVLSSPSVLCADSRSNGKSKTSSVTCAGTTF